jgi:ATP-dependent Clp protease adaptor protein ClpS
MASDGNEDEKQSIGGATVAERKPEVRKPSLYKVLIHNDDYTPMDFVVMILETYFGKDKAAATEIMLAVHHKGLGTCGVFPFEIAETKVMQVLECAREHEHPLQCTMEKV